MTKLHEILIIPEKNHTNNTEQVQITPSRKVSLEISANHSKYQPKYTKSQNSTHNPHNIKLGHMKSNNKVNYPQSQCITRNFERNFDNLDQSQQKFMKSYTTLHEGPQEI